MISTCSECDHLDYVQTVMLQHGLKWNNMVWNEWAWKRFSSETFQCKKSKCFNTISWWKEILFDWFFLQWVDPIKDQLDQKSVFQLFWSGESIYQIIFAFGWVEDHQTQNNMCFCYLNHHCVTAVKVGWKLVSHVCEHMNYWRRVFSNCFDVLNPNIKSFLFLVEWKIIKHKTICVFVMWTIILSLL